MKSNDRVTRTLSLLQVLDVGLAIACVGYGSCIAADYITSADPCSGVIDPMMIAAGVLFIVIIIGCLVAQTAFFRLCGQLKQQRIFVPENDRALGVIAAACGVNTALLAAVALLCIISGGLMPLILAFLMGSVALIAWILQLLMRRAVALQQENDGTV